MHEIKGKGSTCNARGIFRSKAVSRTMFGTGDGWGRGAGGAVASADPSPPSPVLMVVDDASGPIMGCCWTWGACCLPTGPAQ